MEAPFLERLNWRSDPFAGRFPPWCDRPLCTCGDRCILKSSLMVETRGRRFFQCANLDQTYRKLCNYIEWVDTENPQNDGTRPYARSESRSDYLRRKDEHERRIAAEALEWQVNPLGLPTWREHPECRCGDRCQVIRSVRQRTRGQRCFVCPNIDDDDFVEEVRKCQFIQWIDTVRVTSIGQTITQPETTTQFIQAWMEYERQVQIASLDWRNNLLGLPKWSEHPKCGCRDRCQVATSFAEQTIARWLHCLPQCRRQFRWQSKEVRIHFMDRQCQSYI
nr:uncharacterized protein LOC107279741 [Oryza sativa Japonica Group]